MHYGTDVGSIGGFSNYCNTLYCTVLQLVIQVIACNEGKLKSCYSVAASDNLLNSILYQQCISGTTIQYCTVLQLTSLSYFCDRESENKIIPVQKIFQMVNCVVSEAAPRCKADQSQPRRTLRMLPELPSSEQVGKSPIPTSSPSTITSCSGCKQVPAPWQFSYLCVTYFTLRDLCGVYTSNVNLS